MSARAKSPPAAVRAERSEGSDQGLPPSLRVGRDRIRIRRIKNGWTATPYLFLLPYLVLFVGFVLIPAIYGFYISLHDWDYLLPHKPWVGFRNYTDLFKSNSRDG